jgi:agmatinase
VRGIAQCTSRRRSASSIFDRHIDCQEKDLDERMHTTPWYMGDRASQRAGKEPRPGRLSAAGRCPRPGVKEARRRQTNILTIDRHGEARDREDGGDRARARLGGGRCGLCLLRRR